MSESFSLRLLEANDNRRGDLFARLMGDLFLALGYDQDFRVNIHKTGREVDIEVLHRIEPRRVVAECKATLSKIGGDEVNKFVGILDAEKRKSLNLEVVGYFVSLSGFTETAVEQEKEAGGNRVILLDGSRAIRQLIEGRIVVSPERAIEKAGRCASSHTIHLKPESFELLAHDIGLIWAIYFAQNKQRTHVAFIHADGESLSSNVAATIIEADASVGGDIHSLKYLAPITESTVLQGLTVQAKVKYLNYLASECGEITLEGLPADEVLGSRRLKLEDIFVPLYLEEVSEDREGPSPSQEEEREHKIKKVDKRRWPVGEVISMHSRLAILAAPGGGKTTLLKRIAIAYAFPDRSQRFDDNFPERDWLPLLIRCRQLGNLARSTIGEILRAIPERAEMTELAEAFRDLMSNALRSGKVLLLIDGLDEISDQQDLVTFVNQLRIFLATYPSVSAILTSREAGFRIVAGALSAHCRHYRVSDFDNNDIRRLVLAWHKEVVGDSLEVNREAENLAKTICKSDRVRQLAVNPLLLTTLLLVKRWVGQFPTRRTVLYGKAIEVLLMTWNVQGYEPIDLDEAVPQLAFVALTMMQEGVQRISSRRLKEMLAVARSQMPEVLGYTKISISEFVNRVERRSSILMLSGHEVEQGTLYPMYEYRHLTFQEYLAARAIVEGFYPNRKDGDTLLTMLKPYLDNKQWKEVIVLAAVLSGRNAKPLIQHLLGICKGLPDYRSSEKNRQIGTPLELLSQCILDETQMTPELLEECLEWCIRRSKHHRGNLSILLFKSKYGDRLLNIVRDKYVNSKEDLLRFGDALSDITLYKMEHDFLLEGQLDSKIVSHIEELLVSTEPLQKAEGALACMSFVFQTSRAGFKRDYEPSGDLLASYASLAEKIVDLLYANESSVQLGACWALAWLGRLRSLTFARHSDIIQRLFEIWRDSRLFDLQYVAAWAITALPILDREQLRFTAFLPNEIEFIKEQYSAELDLIDSLPQYVRDRQRLKIKEASLFAGFYWRTPWTDEQLAQLIGNYLSKSFVSSNNKLKGILEKLGEPGMAQLSELQKGEKK